MSALRLLAATVALLAAAGAAPGHADGPAAPSLEELRAMAAEFEPPPVVSRAFAPRLAAPSFITSEEEAEHQLMDTPAPAAPRFVDPVYDSRNTDGRAGAGGRTVAYRSGGRVLTDERIRARAPEALLWRTGYGSWEPTLGVTKDGTIFFSARNTNVDPGVVRSRDGGRTWEEKSPAQHELSLDPYLWVDRATGRIWANDIEASVTCPPVSWSDDDGETWTTLTACGQFDHQTLFGGPPATSTTSGYPHVVYFCAITGGALAGSSTMTGCSRSRDGGTTFLPTDAPAFPVREAPEGYDANPWCDGAAGHGVVDAKGTVYLARGWCAEPYLAVSRDEGDTWERIALPGETLDPNAHEANVAVDAEGTVFVTWVTRSGRVLVTYSRDGAKTFRAPIDVTPPAVTTASLPHIAVGDPGRVAVTFAGSTQAQDAPSESKAWNGYMVVSTDVTAADPTFYGGPINDPADPFWRGECDMTRCGNIGDFLDVEVAPDGTVVAAHVDSCPADGGRTCTAFEVHLPRGEAVMGQLVGGPPLVGTIAEQTPAVTLPSPPATPACRPRKPLRVRLHRPRRGRIESARVYVDGRRVKSLRGRRIPRTVTLRRLPVGKAIVKVVVRSTTGRAVTRSAAYRTCG